jgi:hypothetical protein
MKFFIYASVCLSLIVYAVTVPIKPQLWDYRGEYCIYSREDVRSPLIHRRVDSGLGYIYYCGNGDAKALREKFGKIDGESIIITDDIKYEQILQKFALQKKSESRDGIYHTIYAQNSRYGSVQIVVRKDDIVVGFPVIIGSY